MRNNFAYECVCVHVATWTVVVVVMALHRLTALRSPSTTTTTATATGTRDENKAAQRHLQRINGRESCTRLEVHSLFVWTSLLCQR